MKNLIKSLIIIFYFTFSTSLFAVKKASPEALVRRIYLDLFERLPTESEYLEGKNVIKRGQYSKLVDKMLGNDEFRKKLAKELVAHFKPDDKKFERISLLLIKHIQKNYTSKNSDYRVFLKDFLTAKGVTYGDKMLMFYISDEMPPDIAGRVVQKVLGLPYNCARCHDHPEYSDIKQEDFWKLAAYFNTITKRQIRNKQQLPAISNILKDKKRAIEYFGKKSLDHINKWVLAENTGKNILKEDLMNDMGMMNKKSAINRKNKKNKSKKKGRENRLLSPQLLVLEKKVNLEKLQIKYRVDGKIKQVNAMLPGKSFQRSSKEYPREVFAKWVTSSSNPYTARATVNWLARWLYGRGLVMPVLDIYGGEGSKKSLLNKHAQYFKNSHYNLIKLIKKMVLAKEYLLRNSVTTDEEHFIALNARRYRHLTGEQIINSFDNDMLSAFGQSTFSQKRKAFKKFRLEKNKKKIVEKIFPRSIEDTESSYKGSVGQSLFMANNQKTLQYIKQIAFKAFKKKKSLPEKDWLTSLIRKFYTREPTSQELSFFTNLITSNTDFKQSGYFEVVWTIINSAEMRIY